MPVAEKKYYNQLLDSLFKEHDELVNVTLQYFHKLGIPVQEEEVNEFILSHPDYPSLLCISDCLTQWKVENISLKVEKDQIDQYPLPMLVHASGFKIVVRVTVDEIIYLNKLGREVQAPKKEFLSKWDAIALLAQSPEGVEDKKNEVINKGKSGMISPVFLIGLLLVSIATASAIYFLSHSLVPSLSYSFLLLLNLAGVVLATILVWYQFDKNSPALKRLCGNETGDKDCSATLDSRYAKLFGRVSWSEIGFFYFTGTLLLLLITPGYTALAGWLNVLALPYAIFSVSYQKFVAKKWCPLCLAVQAVLVAGSITAWLGGFLQKGIPVITAQVVFTIGVLYMLPSLVWYLVKPIISGYQKNKNSRYELARLKNDPGIFNKILSEQKRMIAPATNMGITLGNKEAKTTIIKVCNPYCAPCARAHQELKELLKHDNVKVQVIFTATNAPDDKRTAPVKHLLAIAAKGNESEIEKAMDDWYMSEEKNYEAFAGKYRMNGELKKQDEKINEMAAWCTATDISYTPSIFVNGHQLPETYKIDDLKYIVKAFN
ncbi:MAG TPA: thioredoxin domain-containing protein [Chitinophagaceae bacterium]|nr:thioredoxin domain-containing protein [Chitinophagaceae bacterium]